MTGSDWAAFVAPPVATALAIFGLLMVRATKVSEFRQAWINDQRSDLATILSTAASLAGPHAQIRDELLAFDAASCRIRLRQNPVVKKNGQREWQDVIDDIATLRGMVTAAPAGNPTTLTTAIVTKSQHWLKEEWERVRFGERIVKVVVLFAAILIGASVLPQAGFLIARAVGLSRYLPEGLTFSAMIGNGP
jgi:hypothetical protein